MLGDLVQISNYKNKVKLSNATMQDDYKSLYLLPRLSQVASFESQSASSSMGLDEEDYPMYSSMLSPKREEEPSIENCPMAGLQCANPVSIAFDDFGTLLVP